MTFMESVASATLTDGIVQALEGFKTAEGLNLQIYRGRPASLFPPTAFIDARHDTIELNFAGADAYHAMEHTAVVEVVVVHGIFDTGEAIDQRDAFVDAFNNYLRANRMVGLAGGNSVLERVRLDDIPNYVPDWIERPLTYFATLYRLEVSITD